MHPNEISLKDATARMKHVALAESMGKNHVAALKTQAARQEVELVTTPEPNAIL